MTCSTCGDELEIGSWPFCKGPGSHTKGNNNVIGDECDVTIRHGLCNDDGSPRRYTSKQEIKREEKRRNMTNYVVHATRPDTDKSKHTTRWI